MSVESKYKPVSYTGTGGTSVFPFGWVCYEKTWIHVLSDGLELTQGTDYTVALESTSGGSITLSAPLAAGKVLIIWMDVPITQENRYPNTGQLNTVTIERALDKQTLIAQQQQDAIERSVKVPVGSQEKPEDVVANIYTARDAAAASANDASVQATKAAGSALAAANSASAAAQTVQTATAEAVTEATTQANSAQTSAAAAAQSALDAAASVPENLVERVTATETKNTNQDARLDAVESGVTAISTTLIGAVIPITCADGYVPNGCVPANGGEYTRAQFPSLYDTYLASGKLLTCTYAAWTAQVGLTGNCAKFAVDTNNKKFKVPLVKDGDSVTQASSAAELGKSVKAGLPNATSPANSLYCGGENSPAPSGALVKSRRNTGQAPSLGTATGSNTEYVGIDLSQASSIYRNDVTTVLDEQVRLRHFVVVASAQNSASVFDWSNYMAALSGKMNSDGSNAIANAMKYYFMARDEKTSGTNGGSTSAGSVMTRDVNTVKVNTIGASLVSNRITLQAGHYLIKAIMPAIGTNVTRAVLYDYTHSTYLEYGQNVYSSSAVSANCLASVEADITFATETQIEVRMYTGAANANGCGVATNIPGVVEVYTKVEIWRL